MFAGIVRGKTEGGGHFLLSAQPGPCGALS